MATSKDYHGSSLKMFHPLCNRALNLQFGEGCIPLARWFQTNDWDYPIGNRRWFAFGRSKEIETDSYLLDSYFLLTATSSRRPWAAPRSPTLASTNSAAHIISSGWNPEYSRSSFGWKLSEARSEIWCEDELLGILSRTYNCRLFRSIESFVVETRGVT